MKKILIVVDFQNDFVTGSLGFEAAQKIEQRIVERIAEARAEGTEVLFTLDTHTEDYMNTVEGEFLPVPHCIKGTEGHKLTPALEAVAKEGECMEKPTFPSLELAEYLRKGEYDEVELTGVVTNICVISNAVMAKAALPNAKITVDSSACASNDPELESKSLDIIRNLHIIVK